MPDRDDLILRWELGQADANDETALAEVLRDPAARRAFTRNALVVAALGAPLPTAAAGMPPPSTTTTRGKPLRMRRTRAPSAPRWAFAAGMLLTIGLAALLVMGMPRSDSATPTPRTAQPTPPSVTPPFAQLTIAGAAQIRTNTGLQRAGHDGDALAAGETIEAGIRPAVIVLRANSARLELDAGTHLSLPSEIADPATATVRLALEHGGVRAEVAARPSGAPFIISTPQANAEVVGTSFHFGITADGARLTVAHGAVRLSTPNDPGVLVRAGQSGLASDGLASLAPSAADNDQPLPAGARVLWRFDEHNNGNWRGVIDDATAGGPARRSVGPRPGDQWCSAEIRSPQADESWTVAPNTWLRFRYHVERFTAGLVLEVHLKPADETNYAQPFITNTDDGWHSATLRVDGAFHHLERKGQLLAVGEQLRGVVWCALRKDGTTATPARFWIRDAVVFTTP